MVEVPKPSGRKQKRGCCVPSGGGGGKTGYPRPPDPSPVSNDIMVAKVIFMGDSRVGKTAIISAFMEGR